MDTTPFRIDAAGLPVAGRIYRTAHGDFADTNRRLVLLHGAGVPGELTWQFVVQHLSQWDEILVPDLPLMGRSRLPGNDMPSFSQYLSALKDLIDHFDWEHFDLGGYSFGGLLAMHLQKEYEIDRLVLIEPAALSSTDPSELLRRADVYSNLGKNLIDNSGDADVYRAFLDVVSPNRARDPRLDDIAIKRLMAESHGLAAGVTAVAEALSEYSHFYSEWVPPVKGLSVVGGLSPSAMHDRHSLLDGVCGWRFESLPRTDHGLIYVRPRDIARSMNGLYSESA